MAATAQARLWGNFPAGCLHCPPPTRDKASTAARVHPRCGEEEVCAHVGMDAQILDTLGRIPRGRHVYMYVSVACV